jgi:hypothetical protein
METLPNACVDARSPSHASPWILRTRGPICAGRRSLSGKKHLRRAPGKSEKIALWKMMFSLSKWVDFHFHSSFKQSKIMEPNILVSSAVEIPLRCYSKKTNGMERFQFATYVIM